MEKTANVSGAISETVISTQAATSVLPVFCNMPICDWYALCKYTIHDIKIKWGGHIQANS